MAWISKSNGYVYFKRLISSPHLTEPCKSVLSQQIGLGSREFHQDLSIFMRLFAGALSHS